MILIQLGSQAFIQGCVLSGDSFSGCIFQNGSLPNAYPAANYRVDGISCEFLGDSALRSVTYPGSNYSRFRSALHRTLRAAHLFLDTDTGGWDSYN